MSDLNDPRVLFAAERTLLAWNRTSLSLIAFGFVAERSSLLLEIFSSSRDSAGGEGGLVFWLGLAFIVLGVFTAAYSCRQYAMILKTLRPAELPDRYWTRGGLFVNAAVALLGAILAVGLYVLRA